MWWVWRSWLARQIVALEAVGSNPTIHPNSTVMVDRLLDRSQVVRQRTLTPSSRWFESSRSSHFFIPFIKKENIFICRFLQIILGCRQAVRHQILALAFRGFESFHPSHLFYATLSLICKNQSIGWHNSQRVPFPVSAFCSALGTYFRSLLCNAGVLGKMGFFLILRRGTLSISPV